MPKVVQECHINGTIQSKIDQICPVLMSFQLKTGHYTGDETIFTAIDFPYKLDHFQKHSLCSIEDGHHIIVTAHTGSGKTTVAEYAIAKHINNNKKVIYTTPIKALSNQIKNGLERKYPTWDVGIKTGDIVINEDAQVLIMTTEILRNQLFKGDFDSDHVSCVIFDEVHWIKDKSRGKVWEESIIMMPKEVQMVMLSATIPDADKFAQWIANCKGWQTDLVPTTHRVVPLTHYIMCPEGLCEIMDNHGKFQTSRVEEASRKFSFEPYQLDKYISRLQVSEMLPAFFFCFSRKDCENHSSNIKTPLISGKEATEISHLFDSYIREFGDRYLGSAQVWKVKSLLEKGVCYHHSGLLPVLKEIIELIFSKGLLKVLFVTETFAAGVNMPAKTVVFTGLKKYDDSVRDLRDLNPEEYSQMAGRAGRRGLDKKGNVILLPFHHSEKRLEAPRLKKILCGDLQPISSQFAVDPSFVLKAIYSRDTESATEITEYVNRSLLNQQHSRNITQMEVDLKKLNYRLSELERLVPVAEFENPDSKYSQFLELSKMPSAASQTKNRRKKRGATQSASVIFSEVEKQFYAEALQKYNSYLEIKKQRDQTFKDFETSSTVFIEFINRIINYLRKLEYITEESESKSLNLTKSDLTVKGIVASNINDCNSVVLTEMLTNGYFEDLDTDEIIGLLSVFIGEREEDREHELTPRLRDTTHNLLEQLIPEIEQKEALYLPSALLTSDWYQYNTEYVDISTLWASGAAFRTIQEKVSVIYEGNFVKNMLKLKNLCETLIKSAEIIGDHILIKKIEKYNELLIRDIVTPESLYLKKSALTL